MVIDRLARTTVLVADSQRLFAEALGALLASEPDFSVVDDYPTTGPDVVKAVAEHRPAIAVVDLFMPGMTGAARTRAILAQSPSTRIVTTTWFANRRELRAVGAAGHWVSVRKWTDAELLFEILRWAHTSESPRDVRGLPGEPAVVWRAVGAPSRIEQMQTIRGARRLSAREIEVLTHLAHGESQRQIAGELGVSPSTVNKHVQGIFSVFGVNSKLGAVALGREDGLIDDSQLDATVKSAGNTRAQPDDGAPVWSPHSCAHRGGRDGAGIAVMIAEPQTLLARGLACALETVAGLDVIPCLMTDGPNTVDAARAHQPDVLLMSYWLPRLDGAEATRLVMQASPGTRVLVMSESLDVDPIVKVFEAGAVGYLPKSMGLSEMVDAIQRAHDGETEDFVEHATQMVDEVLRHRFDVRAARERFESLTGREFEVLAMLHEGRSSKQIARILDVQLATVRTLISRIRSKVGAHTQLEAVALARWVGVVEGPRELLWPLPGAAG